MNPKKIGKKIICSLLEAQTLRLRKKNNFKIVAVVGSVGKTSTKLAIAKTLNQKLRVIYQEGNYNDRLTVPLVLFGHVEPNIFNIYAWFKILLNNERVIRTSYPHEVAILELGTDAPGQLSEFAYLKPDLVVLTSIAAEHMAYFGNLESVAKEELTPLSYSSQALLNIDSIPTQYLPESHYLSYGMSENADYRIKILEQENLSGQKLEISLPGEKACEVDVNFLGSQGATALLAAASVAQNFNMTEKEIKLALEKLSPASGRMQVLRGVKNSKIIDDTYNASPVAVRAALDVLYNVKAPYKIAILGSMNELGQISAEEHKELGAYCDPKKLDMIVTIGNEAGIYLAPSAEAQGCKAVSFVSPIDAGKYVYENLKEDAVVLAKGSQNGVFAEEAVKVLLENQADSARLVRQSSYWLKIKNQQF